jgi:hypothetical protein
LPSFAGKLKAEFAVNAVATRRNIAFNPLPSNNAACSSPNFIKIAVCLDDEKSTFC